MQTIGILGGIASGKSTVALMLQDLGGVVFDADQAGHQVLEEPEVKRAIQTRFSSSVLDDQGNVSRRKLAEKVFGPTSQHAQALTELEQITHPRITIRLHEARATAQSQGAPAFILDAPVMIKAGWHAECDHLIFVEAAREARLARALDRGWTEKEFDMREATQEKLEQKRELADYVVTSDADLSQLRKQIQAFWSRHVQASPSGGGLPR